MCMPLVMFTLDAGDVLKRKGHLSDGAKVTFNVIAVHMTGSVGK